MRRTHHEGKAIERFGGDGTITMHERKDVLFPSSTHETHRTTTTTPIDDRLGTRRPERVVSVGLQSTSGCREKLQRIVRLEHGPRDGHFRRDPQRFRSTTKEKPERQIL